MNVLVTGATGFLGERLALRLTGLGYKVTGTGRNGQAGRRLEEQGIRFVSADLRHADDIRKLCFKQEAVFHCAALSSPWGAYTDFYNNNVLGTRHIAEGCLENGVSRLLYVSTPSVYFDYTERYQITEEEPFPSKPANAYAQTKMLAEQEVDRASAQGLPVITIRPRAIFGPGDRTILPRLIEANERGRVPIIDGGKAVIDATYVDNVVDALLLGLESPDTLNGRKFNITNGEPLRFGNLLDKMFAKLGQPLRALPLSYRKAYLAASAMELAARLFHPAKEPQLTRYTVGVIARSQTLDISAARNELGYSPAISVEQGMDRFAKWWKEEQAAGRKE